VTRAEIEASFDRYASMVWRRAVAIVGDPAEAEDVVQDVFISALQSAERFERRSEVSTWLYRITTNVALNRLRSRGRHRAKLDAHAATADLRAPIEAEPEHRVLVRRLLAAADEREAAAAVYVYVDGMSHQEAAELLGVSKRTVGNLIERFERFARGFVAEAPLGARLGEGA
jgi:RNA polymerase sigma-70 factor (ECF subfamily)